MFTGVINFNFILSKSPLSVEEIWYAAAAPAALLMIASFVYSISSKKKKEEESMSIGTEIVEVAIADDVRVLYKRRSSRDDEISWKSASDVLFEEDTDEMMLEMDAKYAEQLQLQEALLISQNSTHRASLGSLLKQVVCKICLEKHESWQMFRNSTCSHSFCYECTAKHATTKIQAKHKTITCPGINCNSTLDFSTLRLIIPREILIKWDDFLCESTIPESHKLYCPFTDCSVLLIDDGASNGVIKVDCPVCRRSFCKACRVPWHSEFSCKEFGKLKGKNDDEKAVALAKKKKWKKCPNCNFFVEKEKGCVHITCRCKYEFCYTCGDKWSGTHYGCKGLNR